MTPDSRWESFGITQRFLEEKAEWMSRDPGFPGTVIMYFRTAGSLMRFAWYDYTLTGIALFQAIAGLEGALRIRYDPKEDKFKELLSRALREGVISDQTFSDKLPLMKRFRDRIDEGAVTYAEKLASLVPNLRNSYFHGNYILFPEAVPLAIQIKEAAEAILISDADAA